MRKFLNDEREGNILHASFLMRFRRRQDLTTPVDFGNFLTHIAPFVFEGEEGLINLLREISQKFST